MKKRLFTKKILLFYLCLCTTFTYSQTIDNDLQQLITKAFEKSYTAQITKQQNEQIEWDKKNAKNTFIPNLSGNISYVRFNEDIYLPADLNTLLLGTEKLLIKEQLGIPFNTPLPGNVPVKPIDPLQKKDLLTMSANMKWVLFSGGKVHHGLQALEHQQNAVRYLSQKERNQITQEMTALYDKLALLIASESTLKASDNYLSEQKRFVEGAISNGLATPLERQKIELAVQRLATKKLELHNNKRLLLEKIRQMTNEDVITLEKYQPALSGILLDTSIATQQRPEIKMLDEAIAATDSKYKMEMTECIPKVAAFGNYQFYKNDFTIEIPTWTVGVGLQWNIFDGLTARNKAKKAQSEKTVYELQKAEAQELIELSQTKAKLELETAIQKINMVREQVTLSEKNLDLSNKQYRNGLTTISEYLDSVNDVEKSHLDMYNAYYEQRKAIYAFLEAKGILVDYVFGSVH